MPPCKSHRPRPNQSASRKDSAEFQGAISHRRGAEVPFHRNGHGAGSILDLLGFKRRQAVVDRPGDCRAMSEIDQAAEILRRGGLVAFPTETVYGLGADARNSDAVKK